MPLFDRSVPSPRLVFVPPTGDGHANEVEADKEAGDVEPASKPCMVRPIDHTVGDERSTDCCKPYRHSRLPCESNVLVMSGGHPPLFRSVPCAVRSMPVLGTTPQPEIDG